MRQRKLRSIGLVAAIIVLAACTTQTGQDTATTSPSTTAAPTTTAEARSDFPSTGPVEPGFYHLPPSAWNLAGLTMTMPEGWEAQYGIPGAIKHSDQDGELGFYFVIVDSIYADPCIGSEGEGASNLIEVGPSVDDLVNALLEQPNTVASGPMDTSVGGLPARRIDLTLAEDPETATCNVNIPGSLQIWHSEPVDKYFVLPGHGTASVYILDVNGERQVLLTGRNDGATADDVAQMQTIIDSIRIDAPSTTSAPGTLPDLGLPGFSPNEPAGEYGWSNITGSGNWLHKVVYDPVTDKNRQTQIAFGVRDDCFAVPSFDGAPVGEPAAEPTQVTVAGFEGLYLEPYDHYNGYWNRTTADGSDSQTRGAYALNIADQTLCVYLGWDAATTEDELKAARDVIASIRAVPFKHGIRINFTLPAGWDTG